MKKEDIKLVSNTYSPYEDLYKLLIKTNNIEICKFLLDYDGVWKRLELKWMMNYFQGKEEYEKCNVLKKFMEEDITTMNYNGVGIDGTSGCVGIDGVNE